ncbi:acyl-CoA carboxylase subunit epsilon [Nocardia sp. NBC_00565]|uniref:acyl-CoA carboxylase subunit epsilon n=1 Tax=Nocardia sp. NBC_00565 TaxID=2975993 RepID=UPI002E804ED4|nr:acyl-CoA carboxylase subunit epsilon [Nocardia sp. NBC_00565]WUC00865.1 acyl-CoA carboxylase subunit epsilon [Nocardia sp. NBC_00565]
MTPVLRIERGNPTDEELAALTVVLLAALAGATPSDQRRPATVRWLRPERRPAFIAPHSWVA